MDGMHPAGKAFREIALATDRPRDTADDPQEDDGGIVARLLRFIRG